MIQSTSMKYAIIAISGSQFKVEENKNLTVDNLNLKEGETSSTNQVLLLVDDKSISIGSPFIKDAKVEFKVIKNYKGKKLKIFKYKAKSRYRLTQGFRSQLSDIEITKIGLSKSTPVKKAAVPKKAATTKKATVSKKTSPKKVVSKK